MFGFVTRHPSRLLIATTALTLAACEPATAPTQLDPAQLDVYANVSATPIKTLVITVTGPGIPTALVFNMDINDKDEATGSISIPAGAGRKIEVDAFDSEGIKTHHGEETVSVKPGKNATALKIVLLPIAGDQEVTTNFGKFIVKLNSAAMTLTAGGPPKELIVDVTDTDTPPNVIQLKEGDVKWATTNPALFTVAAVVGSPNKASVTGKAPGTGRVVATYNGVADTTNITVQAAP